MLNKNWMAMAIALGLGTVGCALESDPEGSHSDPAEFEEVGSEPGASAKNDPQNKVLFTSNYSENGAFEVVEDRTGTLRHVVSGRIGEDDPEEVGALVSASPVDTYLALHPEEEEAPAELAELAARFPELPSADEINAEEDVEVASPITEAAAPIRSASLFHFWTNVCKTFPYPGWLGNFLEYRPISCRYGDISSSADVWDLESIETEVCYVSSTPLESADRIYGYNDSTTSSIFVYGSTGSTIWYDPAGSAPFYLTIPRSTWKYSVLNRTDIKRACVSGGGFDRHWLYLDPQGGITVHRVSSK